jgi:hypothetical protein
MEGGGQWQRRLRERWVKTAAANQCARARRWRPLSEGARRGLGASAQTGSPTGGSHMVFDISNLSKNGSTLKIQNGCLFQFIQKWLNFKNSKWLPYLAPKIRSFCMLLYLDIVNNFLN